MGDTIVFTVRRVPDVTMDVAERPTIVSPFFASEGHVSRAASPANGAVRFAPRQFLLLTRFTSAVQLTESGDMSSSSQSPPSEPQTSVTPPALPEHWMRGPIPGVDVLVAPVLYTFAQAREELANCTVGLTTEQIWATPYGFGSVGFHIRHIARSTERLMTYVQGSQLTPAQLAALKSEKDPGATREELLAELETAHRAAERVVRDLNPANLRDPREIGRKRLPSTVIGLLTHIAEHTQRHIGQAISAAKLSRVTAIQTEP